MISQTAEYALRSMTCLGENPDKPMTNQQIAAMARIPVGYLSKVMQALGRAGLVRAYRGVHGGFVLTKAPPDLAILEIIQAVDPLQRIKTCPLGKPEHRSELCALHRRLDQAMAMVEGVFARTSLADVLARDKSRDGGNDAAAAKKRK